MTAIGKSGLTFALLLLFGSLTVQGASLSGTYSLNVDGPAKVWDLTGNYSDELADLDMDYTLNMDPTGKFTGTGTAHAGNMFGASVDLDFDFSFSGAVKSAGNVTRVSMNIKMTGSGYVEGYYCTANATMKENLEVDETSRMLTGYSSGKISVAVPELKKKVSGALAREEVDTALPPGTDGSWSVLLTVNQAGTKYTGEGSVEGFTGDLPFTVTGSYSSKTDTSKLSLKGTGVNKGMALSLSTQTAGNDLVIKTLSGKVLGQAVKIINQ